MIKRKTLSLCIVLSCISVNATAEEGLSFLKNRPQNKAEPMPLADGVSQPYQYGQVFGTHPFFSKLSLKAFEKKEGKYVEVEREINGLVPGMILDLPLYESQKRFSTRQFTDDGLPKPTEQDNYFWSDWDKGDSEIDQNEIDIKWYRLTLKPELKYPNSANCEVLGKTIEFNASDSNSLRWEKMQKRALEVGADFSVMHDDDTTPWNKCFDVSEITVEQIDSTMTEDLELSEFPIVIPFMDDSERIGFSITPISKFGFPKEGFTAYVWDISKIWAHKTPEKNLSSEVGINASIVLFPENEEFNQDRALPIGEHPFIRSPEIIAFDTAYRVRIFDKEYYDLNKDNLDNRFDLSKIEKAPFVDLISDNLSNQEEINNAIYQGFYVNRQYVAIIEIRDSSNRVRRLTREEVEGQVPQGELNLFWELVWEDRDNGELYINEDKTLFDANKEYRIIYSYEDEKQSVKPKIAIKYILNDQNQDTNQIEYVQFNSQINNVDVGPVLDNKVNPEMSEQSFKASINFRIDEELEITPSNYYELVDPAGFTEIGAADDELKD
ncbi:hypothetical protein [Thorsellia anophelis]|uniref:Uncharacterized protein n=1 Tax=Thorsellia anophelis DSM 18579 TaxID=1123402 RepID=A0A1I0ALP0_9GAMM|nr:hypothetical protein [Thorsellia anophelis]SES95301.1 hypothetical protein SAMN02583745_00972 [Thorsellia anophelis DSM 18579]